MKENEGDGDRVLLYKYSRIQYYIVNISPPEWLELGKYSILSPSFFFVSRLIPLSYLVQGQGAAVRGTQKP